MEPNPYASPSAPPVQLGASPSAAPFAFLASLVVYLAILPFMYSDGLLDRPWDGLILPKVFLSVSMIVTVLGIATFTMLARVSGKPMGLGRAVCVAHLVIITVETLSLLRIPRFLWRYLKLGPLHQYHLNNILPEMLVLLAVAEIILLHRALKRLEKSSLLANWTLFALLTVNPTAVCLDEVVRHLPVSLGYLYKPLWALVLVSSQGTICALLAWRVLRIRQNWRSEAPPKGRDDHEAA